MVSPAPPRPGEFWQLTADPTRVALILDVRDARVTYTWVDRPEADESAPLAGWPSTFEVVLEREDHAAAKPARRKCLIDDVAHRFHGRSVLELGPHIGGLTESIVRHASATTVIENNPRCIAILAARFGDTAEILLDDVHHALWHLPPRRFDIILCAGLLYHSAHPLWLLEAMAHLAPGAILLDTIDTGATDAHAAPAPMTNTLNYRYNHRPDCGLSIHLADTVIEKAMTQLGYGRITRIDKSAAEPTSDSDYFQAWRRGLAAWFEPEVRS